MTVTLLDRPLVEDTLSRRGFLAGAAGAALLAGCGSPAPATRAAATAGYPRTIEQQLGPATIPARPQRVLALGVIDPDNAVALGVTPVGRGDMGMPDGGWPWLGSALAGRPLNVVGALQGVDYEKVAALRPDLILAGTMIGLDQEVFGRLSALAPTITYETGYFVDTWQQQLRLAGRALAAEDRAEQAITAVTDRMAATVRDHPAFAGKTFSRTAIGGLDSIQTITQPGFANIQLLEQLGFTLAPALAARGAQSFAPISPEQIALLDADLMVVSYRTPQAQAPVEAFGLFQQLPVVRRGGYLVLDEALSAATSSPSPLAIPYALDRLVPELTRIFPAT